jgi:hypothetical protein
LSLTIPSVQVVAPPLSGITSQDSTGHLANVTSARLKPKNQQRKLAESPNSPAEGLKSQTAPRKLPVLSVDRCFRKSDLLLATAALPVA